MIKQYAWGNPQSAIRGLFIQTQTYYAVRMACGDMGLTTCDPSLTAALSLFGRYEFTDGNWQRIGDKDDFPVQLNPGSAEAIALDSLLRPTSNDIRFLRKGERIMGKLCRS